MNELIKHPGGRPSVFCQDILDKTEYYLANYKRIGHAIPSYQGLSRYLKVSERIIYYWAKEEGKEEFLHMLEDILTEQCFSTMNQGLKNEVNSNIAKLILAKHGYHDKAEISTFDMSANTQEDRWSVETVDPAQEQARQALEEQRADLERREQQLALAYKELEEHKQQ